MKLSKSRKGLLCWRQCRQDMMTRWIWSVCTGWRQKFGKIFLYTLTLSNINRFSDLFTVRIRRKFAIIQSLKIPPHWLGQTVTVFHWSRHWLVASPAWMRRPAARQIHWTFDVKPVDVTVTLDNNWDTRTYIPVVNFLKCVVTEVVLFSISF